MTRPIAALAILLAASAYAQEPEPSPTPAEGFGYPQLALEPGEPDRDPTDFRFVPRIRFGQPDEWPAVAELLRPIDATTYYTSCSGTLITRNVFLTAAHCLDDPGTGLLILASRLLIRTNVSSQQYEHAAAGPIYLHPTYDAGILFLRTPAPEAVPAVLYSKPPGTFTVPPSLWVDRGYGLYARAFGYGVTQFGSQPLLTPYAVTLPLVSSSEFDYAQRVAFGGGPYYGFPDDVHVVDWTRLDHGASYGPGDSGGATITWDLDDNRDEEELIGVNRAIIPDPITGLATAMGIATRVDLIEDWVVATINGRNGRGCPGNPVQTCQRPKSASISSSVSRTAFRWFVNDEMLPTPNEAQGWMACIYSDGALVRTVAPPPELRCGHGYRCWRESRSTVYPGATWRNGGGMHGAKSLVFRHSPTRSFMKLFLDPGVTIPGTGAQVQIHVAGGCIAAAFPHNEETRIPAIVFRSSHPIL